MLKSKTRFLIIGIIIALIIGLAIPFLFSLNLQEIWNIIKIISVFVGVTAYFFIYKKYLWLALAIVPVSIIAGQIYTLKIKEFSYEISLAEIIIILCVLFFFLDKFIKRDLKFKFSSTGFYFLLYILLMALSLLWVEYIPKAIIAIRVFLFHFAVFFIVINSIKGQKNIKKALWAVPFTGLLVGLQLLWKVYELGGFIAVPERTTIITRVGSWVFISAVLIITVPLSYTLAFLNKELWKKILLWGSSVFSAACSIFTLGKGEILSLFVGIIYLVRKLKQRRITTILTLVIIILLIIIPLTSFSTKFIERIKNFPQDPNVQFRIDEFKTGIILFINHPFLGVGAGNLKMFYKKELRYQIETESSNFILQILAEQGIAGFIIFILITKSIRHLFKKVGNRIKSPQEYFLLSGFKAMILIAFLNGMVEVTFVGLNYGILFWYMIGLLAAWGEIFTNKKTA